MLYKALLRPLLFLRDPEKAHDQTLSLISSLSFLEAPLERLFAVKDARLEVRSIEDRDIAGSDRTASPAKAGKARMVASAVAPRA